MKSKGLLIWFLSAVVVAILFLIPSNISKMAKGKTLDFSKNGGVLLTKVGYRFNRFFSIFFEIGKLRKDNQELADKLVELKVDSSKLSELEIENRQIKELLNYQNSNSTKNLLANIVGADPIGFYDTVIIDKGKNNGVNVGNAVTSLGVLVGKVSEVWESGSKVVLITSKDSITQAMLQNSRTTGILKGGISGMILENIPLDTVVTGNENVVTSGLGETLPKNIFIGNVDRDISIGSDIFKSIKIKSPIDFSKLEFVLVIINEK